MKKLVTTLLPFIDVALSPIVFLSSALLLLIRKAGIHRMNLSRKIFNKIGIFPIRDHYYEPLFNSSHLSKSLREDRFLPGLDFNTKEQLEILNKFSFNEELIKIPLEKRRKLEFYYHNGRFEAGDAEYLYNIIRFFKPAKIIEVGCGYSTLMAINAIKENEKENSSYSCEHICIEPYEMSWLEKTSAKVIRKRIEDVDRTIFKGLSYNDIFFIDSSHIIRPQGDVLVEYLEILPLLNSGVLVHIHDIFTPKDYLDKWIQEEIRLWNEQYLLEAFLTFNQKFRVIGALNFLKHNYFKEISSKCPNLKNEPHCEPGSFWIIKN